MAKQSYRTGDQPQTPVSVLGKLAASIVVYVLVWALFSSLFGTKLTWQWGVCTGSVIASIDVVRQYRRSSSVTRLAPAAAIGFGVLSATLILAPLLLGRPDNSPPGIIVAILLLLLLAPSVYLFITGVRRLAEASISG